MYNRLSIPNYTRFSVDSRYVPPIILADFDSLTVGAIDETNITSPTLAELDTSTTGGSWSFFGVTRGLGYIRADAGGSDQALEISTGSTGGFGDWAGRLDFDTPVTVSSFGIGHLEIKFTASTNRSTGFTRQARWDINDGTTNLVRVLFKDGNVYLNGNNIGQVSTHQDNYKVDPWDSTATPVYIAGIFDVIYDITIKIYGDGSVDLSFQGTSGASGTTDSLPAGTVSTTADVSRLENNYNLTNGGMGMYYSAISVYPRGWSV